MKTVFRIPRRRLGLALSPILLSSAFVGAAPAPIEEISGGSAVNKTARQPGGTVHSQAGDPLDAANAGMDDPYYRNQMLLEEIRRLRGLVEEQGNELARLKKQQREDYLDLDGRLSALVSTGAPLVTGSGSATIPDADDAVSGVAGVSGASDQTPSPGSGDASGGASGGDNRAQAAYDRAYSLLKDRKTHDAKVALQQYVADYPASAYTANAHYWLGELHLLDGELPQAETQFLMVVEKYPAHRKVSDATFKLGKVYHLQGKDDKAQKMLERAAVGSDSAARLAQDYLLQNY